MARRLVMALLVAVLVSGAFTLWLGKKMAHGRSAPVQSLLVATTREMEAGDLLKASDLKTIAWPGSAVLKGTFSKPDDLVGRTVLYPLAAGEPVLDHQLSAVGAGAGLSTRIPDGMRALSLKSDQVVGVAGFLLPGTHVDVLVTYRSVTTSEPVTATVLQDARVLAAGQKMQPEPDGKPSTVDVVTLLVSPEDAQKAVLASTQGTVHFVLRNGGDHAQVQDGSIEMSALGGMQTPLQHRAVPVLVAATVRKPKTETAAITKNYAVTMVRGEKQSSESFQ